MAVLEYLGSVVFSFQLLSLFKLSQLISLLVSPFNIFIAFLF